MSHSFIAYIDEAGDDGLGKFRVPGKSGGASHWLTIGATVWRISRDLDAVQWANEIKRKLPAQKSRKALHFQTLDHAQRVMAIRTLCTKPIRTICVMANKPVIPDGIYQKKNQLYFYMCRYLVERISWLCRDYRPKVPEGDGRVKIVFSRRGGMSYPDFQDYLRRLQRAVEEERIQINWPVIDIDGVEARDHSTRAGLQIADLVISGLNVALEPDIYGNCELQFAELLKPLVYCRRNNYLSYGTKIVPTLDRLHLNEQQLRFTRLFEGK